MPTTKPSAAQAAASKSTAAAPSDAPHAVDAVGIALPNGDWGKVAKAPRPAAVKAAPKAEAASNASPKAVEAPARKVAQKVAVTVTAKAVKPERAVKAAVKAAKGGAEVKADKAQKPPKLVKAVKGVKAIRAAKSTKPAKPVSETAPKLKMVRDSFTMPRDDFAIIDRLKLRTIELRRPTKKSEILRAGVRALMALSDAQLQKALDALTPIKTGRPKKG